MALINDRMESYLDSLEKDLPEKLCHLEETAKAEQVPIIRKQTQAMLRFLIRSRKPVNVLEVGTAVGFSAIFMLHYLPENSMVTTIEKVPQRIEQAKKNFSEFELEKRVRFLEGDAQKILEELEKEGNQYDFIFMDAAKGQYMKFLSPALSMLSKEGMIVTDNVLQEGSLIQSKYAVNRRDRTIHERMREYLYYLTHEEGLDTVVIPSGDGIALTVKI